MARAKRSEPIPDEVRRALEAKKRASVAQLLFKVARLVNERAISRLAESGGAPVLRGSVTALLPHLDFDGIRVVELARRVGVSKQAVSQTLAEMVDHGVVELVPDPDDGRAKLARFTSRGADEIVRGLTVLRGIEEELSAAIGTRSFETLHGTLLRLETALQDDDGEERAR